MRRPIKVLISVVAAAAAVCTGATMASARGADDDATDAPITSPDLEKASAAAVAHTGGGEVSGTEVGDEESLYEVEVTLDDDGPGDDFAGLPDPNRRRTPCTTTSA